MAVLTTHKSYYTFCKVSAKCFIFLGTTCDWPLLQFYLTNPLKKICAHNMMWFLGKCVCDYLCHYQRLFMGNGWCGGFVIIKKNLVGLVGGVMFGQSYICSLYYYWKLKECKKSNRVSAKQNQFGLRRYKVVRMRPTKRYEMECFLLVLYKEELIIVSLICKGSSNIMMILKYDVVTLSGCTEYVLQL